MASYFFERYIAPLIRENNYRQIVEIGVGGGANTVNLLQLARELDSFLYCIDPSPSFAPATEYSRLVFLKKPSLVALKAIKHPDCVIIDGDHNWYTVYNELKIIDKRLAPGGSIFLHDVLWPYGRRDMYYVPKRIPKRFRHPYAKMGIVQGSTWLSPEGINADYYNALYEGGSRNGVLTAVEDFLRLTRDYDFSVVQEQHGLGILQKQPISPKMPRTRLVPASEPDADPACRLTPEEGRRRQSDTGRLFAMLAEQRRTAQGNEFRFRGDPDALWQEVSTFVDEEARCCPFFTFEQIEEPDGVLLRVSGKSIGKE